VATLRSPDARRLAAAAQTNLAARARRIAGSVRERAGDRLAQRNGAGEPPAGTEPAAGTKPAVAVADPPDGPTVRFDAGHYYSSMYDARELLAEPARSRIWPQTPHDRPGIDFREDAQRAFLVDVLGGQERLVLRDEGDPEDGQYYALNGQFPPLDAWVLEGMLRHLRPRRMIEIGSGFSSLITAQVNREVLGGALEFVCIEPYPRGFLSTGVEGISELVVSKVEDVALERFEALGDGDVLFVDTSHVIRTGNDVAWIYGQILPRVARGVHVHIHDVFLPGDYPEQWVREGWGWNENYLVEAFLQFNSGFEVLFGAQWALHHAMREIHVACPEFARAPEQGGGSLWLRRV
jgi:Methyltransferase domain